MLQGWRLGFQAPWEEEIAPFPFLFFTFKPLFYLFIFFLLQLWAPGISTTFHPCRDNTALMGKVSCGSLQVHTAREQVSESDSTFSLAYSQTVVYDNTDYCILDLHCYTFIDWTSFAWSCWLNDLFCVRLCLPPCTPHRPSPSCLFHPQKSTFRSN